MNWKPPNMVQLALSQLEHLCDAGNAELIRRAGELAGEHKWLEIVDLLQTSSNPYVKRARSYIAGVVDGITLQKQGFAVLALLIARAVVVHHRQGDVRGHFFAAAADACLATMPTTRDGGTRAELFGHAARWYAQAHKRDTR